MRKYIIAFIVGFVAAGIAGAIGIYHYSREARSTLQLLQENRNSQRELETQLEKLRSINSENERTIADLTGTLQQSEERVSNLTRELEDLEQFVNSGSGSNRDIEEANNGIRAILDSITGKTTD